MGVAALRAAHQAIDGEPKVFDDPIARLLLDDQTAAWLDGGQQGLRTRGAQALRAHVVLRSRLAEERLAAAFDRGVRQYIILGAGFDTFAYRQPSWAAALTIFEVDQPATQREKRARLAASQIDPPPNLTFVDVDFERQTLRDRLESSGLDFSRPSFLSWLGVTMYLNAASNDAVFSFVASLPASSEIVFTFAPLIAPDDGPGSAMIEAMAASVGEPWQTRYAPDVLSARLQELGFSRVWIPTVAELSATYFQGRTDGLPPPRRQTIVSAVV